MTRSASRRAMSRLPGGPKSVAPARVRADSGLHVSSSRPSWTFSRQHPPDRAVDVLLGDRAGTYEVERPLAEAERVRQFNVDPSTQGEYARLGVGLGDAVHGDEERNRPVFRYGRALESPLPSQDPGEQRLVAAGGDAVDVGVGVARRERGRGCGRPGRRRSPRGARG